VPSIIVPFAGDQPFWAWKVHEMGVGSEPVPRKKLTAERLAAAIKAAVSDSDINQRAAEMGARIRAENGVKRAVEVIEQYLEIS
jgi:sterol 3beta-glucosyltransferase